MSQVIIECCANSVQSALNGQKAGANRIELCSNLECGGVTPSYEDIILARSLINIKLFVLIRPRKGNFTYTEKEYNKIISDIQFCKKNHCDGIVIGSLNNDSSVNKDQIKEIVKIARPMEITFNRAFDNSKDIENDLETIINSGCDRLLTAGKKDNVEDGIENLQKILDITNKRIDILAGSGVNHANIKSLYKIGIREFHLSGKETNTNGILETNVELIRLAVDKSKNLA